MTVSHGKPYAGKPHVRFDEGAGVPGKGRSALLHEYEWWSSYDHVTEGQRDYESNILTTDEAKGQPLRA